MVSLSGGLHKEEGVEIFELSAKGAATLRPGGGSVAKDGATDTVGRAEPARALR